MKESVMLGQTVVWQPPGTTLRTPLVDAAGHLQIDVITTVDPPSFDVLLSTRASELTVTAINNQLANLSFDPAGNLEVIVNLALPAGANLIGDVRISDGTDILDINECGQDFSGEEGIIVQGVQFSGTDKIYCLPVVDRSAVDFAYDSFSVLTLPVTTEDMEGVKLIGYDTVTPLWRHVLVDTIGRVIVTV